MPRTKKVICTSFSRSDMKDLPEFNWLLVVLQESIKAIPYSGTQEDRCYNSLRLRHIENRKVSRTRKVYNMILSKTVGVSASTNLEKQAAHMLAIENSQAENCGGIALDAYYRCIERGLRVTLLSVGNEEEDHVILRLISQNGQKYIFDPQHGYGYSESIFNEKVKLWNKGRQGFVDYSVNKHGVLTTENVHTLENISQCKLKLKNLLKT